jgi:hypothetical protein
MSKLLIGHLREDSCKSGAYLHSNNSGVVTTRYTHVLLIIFPLLFNDTNQATPPVALLMHEDFALTNIMTPSVNEV